VVWTEEDADRDARLRVAVELAPGESPSEERADSVAESVTVALRRLNSEFANYVPADRQAPRIELRPAGDPELFPPGVKHRYTAAE
jgi:phenylacetate-CoA ligase